MYIKRRVKLAIILFLIVCNFIVGLIYIKSRENPSLDIFEEATPQVTPTVLQTDEKIIDGFPSFPIYTGAKIESSQINQATTQMGVSYQAFLETNDNVSTVIAWYIQRLTTDGWTITRPNDPVSQLDDQNFIVEKGDYKATVNVEHEGEEGTEISIYIEQ